MGEKDEKYLSKGYELRGLFVALFFTIGLGVASWFASWETNETVSPTGDIVKTTKFNSETTRSLIDIFKGLAIGAGTSSLALYGLKNSTAKKDGAVVMGDRTL